MSVDVRSARGAGERSTVKSPEKREGPSGRRYAQIAAEANGGAGHPDPVAHTTSLGYSEEELIKACECRIQTCTDRAAATRRLFS